MLKTKHEVRLDNARSNLLRLQTMVELLPPNKRADVDTRVTMLQMRRKEPTDTETLAQAIVSADILVKHLERVT